MLLQLKDISFEINDKKILNNINLDIDLNKFIVITGPNGSGKSSLMKIISGIEKQTSGTIIFNGTDISNYSIEQRANLGISFAFQQPIKFKGLTVYDILKIAANNKINKLEAMDILKEVGLEPSEYINRQLDNTLSGGEHKRIELATVLLRKKALTIFDEPEAGIDLWSFNELIDLFKTFKENNGTTIIISHQEKILKIAEEVILIEKGTIKKIGTYEEVVGDKHDR